ncbi:MAG: hypothetical protein IR160_12315 [Salinibacterium sp.]|nr:acetyl-CoA hydrolase/transferase C-terminal domain-containing protein [Salinibacterium sp.]MBF0673355.1 hypothetical protein [Salinibacterium sp.]
MKLLERDEAFRDLGPGTRFVAGNVTGTPSTLLAALAHRADEVGDLTLASGLLLGDVPLEASIRAGSLRLRAWHIPASLRRLQREGLIDYAPLRLLDLPEVVLESSDVALLRVGPPDADGNCSIGASASYTVEAVNRVPLVIAEVSPDMPRTLGDSMIHVSKIDRMVRSQSPLPEVRPSTPDDISRAIARNVAGLLPAAATLQLGIGAVPEVLAAELAASSDAGLGLLGLVTDAMIPLAERIAAAGGTVTALELMGTAKLMRWAHENPAIVMASSQVVHNPAWLGTIPNLVSVNSAVAVDLLGQVVAESVGGAVIAGVGGSADFSEGAHLSPGGLRIIALSSTTRSGASTIVATHDPADAITAPHHSVDAVVTEHGVAILRGATRRERRHALISIADPRHRHTLGE